jgi:hypothetical protein
MEIRESQMSGSGGKTVSVLGWTGILWPDSLRYTLKCVARLFPLDRVAIDKGGMETAVKCWARCAPISEAICPLVKLEDTVMLFKVLVILVFSKIVVHVVVVHVVVVRVVFVRIGVAHVVVFHVPNRFGPVCSIRQLTQLEAATAAWFGQVLRWHGESGATGMQLGGILCGY